MKIATWNINSLRMRIENLKRFANIEMPDVICLQETKVTDDLFPVQQIKDMGYQYNYFKGEKSYNGVAILSKIPFSDIFSLSFCNDDCRHVAVKIGDLELHNFYIPAGGEEPNVDINPKFAHKLDYCKEFVKWFKKNRSKDDKIVVCGDLNIAPKASDVWSHKQLTNVVSHTEIEILHMKNMYESIEFYDAVRNENNENKIYSWWSYRNKDWKKSNRGRRLDHIWTTKKLTAIIKEQIIFTEARDWEKPSDHVPVIIVMN